MEKHCCECEHTSHFDTNLKTPNGNPAHIYEQNFFESYICTVQTPYGTFNVCKDCAKDCHGE